MKHAQLAAALAVVLMMTVLAAPAISAEDSVDLTATVLEPKPEIGIELSTNALSFGSLYPGNTSDPQDLTVTNIGLKAVDVTVTASDVNEGNLFQNGLLINSAAYGEYKSTLATDASDSAQLALHIPDDFATRGAVSGGATFWAEEHLYLPEADFSASPVFGDVPLDVQFTDLSTNSPTSWSWEFGDGSSSTEQNPLHTYAMAGTYSITLTATNSYGSGTVTKNTYITANAVKLNIYSTALENTNIGAPDSGVPGFIGTDGNGKCLTSGPNNVVNPAFVAWASNVVDYSPANQTIGTQWTNASNALGPVTGDNFNIVSLGDLTEDQILAGEHAGSITLGFDVSIVNGDGADLAVFENGFMSGGKLFAELAYVEVSTDGTTFARFPSISLTEGQVGGYGGIDPTNVYNLAGKHVNAYGNSWGTPFDLNDLVQTPEVLSGSVDLGNINYVRIVDIPGSGDFKDSLGNPIYDAWVTWGSGGLDLEAVGVINAGAHEAPATDFTYTSDGSAVTITGYIGPGGNVIIPSRINGLPVTTIKVNAFKSNANMTSVIIPSSVTTIGNNAFQGCTSLTSVTIPDSVTKLGKNLFNGCTDLATAIIGGGATSMPQSMFANCISLTSVTIPDGVREIGAYMFYGCTALTSVTIPDSVIGLGEFVFQGCTALTSVTIGSGVTILENGVFYGCSSLTSVTIPDSVTTIKGYVFQGCTALTSMVFNGNAPSTVGTDWVNGVPSTMIVYYHPGATGFTNPWNGFTTVELLP